MSAIVLQRNAAKAANSSFVPKWPAGIKLRTRSATVGGMISFGLALEKTGTAGALAHVIVSNFQWAGPNLILGALLMFTVALTLMIEKPEGPKIRL